MICANCAPRASAASVAINGARAHRKAAGGGGPAQFSRKKMTPRQTAGRRNHSKPWAGDLRAARPAGRLGRKGRVYGPLTRRGPRHGAARRRLRRRETSLGDGGAHPAVTRCRRSARPNRRQTRRGSVKMRKPATPPPWCSVIRSRCW